MANARVEGDVWSDLAIKWQRFRACDIEAIGTNAISTQVKLEYPTLDPGSQLLFYRPKSPWPLHEGGAVHCFNMMRSLLGKGVRVALLTDGPTDPQLKVELPAATFHVLDSFEPKAGHAPAMRPMSGLRGRFASYWGMSDDRLNQFASAVANIAPNALVGVGPLGPLMIAAAQAVFDDQQGSRPASVWYAADDLSLLHLTLARRGDFFANMKRSAMMALYERAFRGCIDVAWVVSESDAKAMSVLGGLSEVSIVRNGVDLEFFSPVESTFPELEPVSESCVFWGALDFAPNRDAVCWFVRNVWPHVRETNTDATFRILGLRPPEEITQFDGKDGITVKANVPDLRPEIAQSQVAIFPFISGAGIKNKVLESASLGMASIGSGRAFNGLVPDGEVPMVRAEQPRQWRAELRRLWGDQQARVENGRKLREWVEAFHSWPSAAEAALGSIQKVQPVESDSP